MSNLGTPGRGNDPLNIFLMAGALVLAAIAGALVGFAIDSHNGSTIKVDSAEMAGPGGLRGN